MIGWICEIKYDYQEVKQKFSIGDFLDKIENEVFRGKNSLVSKLRVVSN